MRARLLQALPVLVALVAVPLALAVARDGDAPVRASGAAAAGVTDDDGGVPMFQLAALAPGRSVSRCIRVRYAGDGAGAVQLDGRVEGASLASRIALVVERGTGGAFDGCDGFRGVRVFEGTLADLAGADARAWRAEDGDAATYRFTATAAPNLPEGFDRAAATFTWQATALPGGGSPGGGGDTPGGPGGGDPPAHAGLPGGQPGAAGAPAPGVRAPAAGDGVGAGERGSGDRGRDGRRGTGDRAGRGPAAGGPGGPAGGRDARGGLGRAVDALARAAVDVGKRAAFPAVLVLLIVLFLTAQHRIDQRDPKLALAPVHRETDLPFTPLRLGGPGA